MHYHTPVADFETLMNPADNTAGKGPVYDALTIIASLALALIAISIVFN